MHENPLTVDEIVATLRKTSLQTVIVEGTDDVRIYRRMKEDTRLQNCDFLHCNGRNTVLGIYERRAIFAKKQVAFIADKDMWVFKGIPEIYDGVIFTEGYSIENDLYTDGKALIDALFSPKELALKVEIFENLIQWFAFEVEKWKGNNEDLDFAHITLLNTEVIAENGTQFTNAFLQKRGFKEAEQAILQEIKENYNLQIRGKFLFQVYQKLFEHLRKTENRNKRKEPKSTTYTLEQLHDLCFTEGKRNPNSLISQIKNKILENIAQKN